MDLKGNQYHGSILPGPTALVVGLSKGGQLKVEGITDEFATLAKTKDIMATLNAVIHGDFDEGFRVQDENVNKTVRQNAAGGKANDRKAVTPKMKRKTSAIPIKNAGNKKKKT